jgi:hypothetical protein
MIIPALPVEVLMITNTTHLILTVAVGVRVAVDAADTVTVRRKTAEGVILKAVSFTCWCVLVKPGALPDVVAASSAIVSDALTNTAAIFGGCDCDGT